MTALPIRGWESHLTLATSSRRKFLPSLPSSGILARSSGVTIGKTFCTSSLWPLVSTNPPVPITAPSEQLWIDLHVLLLELLTIDGHVGYPGHTQQLLPDLPVGDYGHLSHVQLV